MDHPPQNDLTTEISLQTKKTSRRPWTLASASDATSPRTPLNLSFKSPTHEPQHKPPEVSFWSDFQDLINSMPSSGTQMASLSLWLQNPSPCRRVRPSPWPSPPRAKKTLQTGGDYKDKREQQQHNNDVNLSTPKMLEKCRYSFRICIQPVHMAEVVWKGNCFPNV